MSREDVHDILEAHLEKHFKSDVFHTNKNEHKLRPVVFCARIVAFALLGILLGSILEWIIEQIPNDQTSRAKCGGLLLLQLVLIAVFLLAASWVLGAGVDEFVMETWAGFLFGVTFFVGQTSLASNTQCLL